MSARALLLLGCWLVVGCREDEPVVDGHPMSHWENEARQWSLLPFWGSRGDERRHIGYRRLVEIGEPAVPTLLELMGSKNSAVSGDAVGALIALGPRARAAVPAMRRILRDPDSRHRISAAAVLRAIGPDAEPALPELEAALREQDSQLGRAAAGALLRIGPPGREVLERAARSGNATVRQRVLEGLAMEAPSTARLPDVARALDDPSPAVRATGVALLRGIRGSGADSVAPLLARATRDSSATVRAAGVSLLHGISGPEADSAVHLLARATRDSSAEVREMARGVWVQAYQHGVSEHFTTVMLMEGSEELRTDVIWQLGNTRRRWHSARPAERGRADSLLLQVLRGSNQEQRVYAARALAMTPARRAIATAAMRQMLP